MILVDGEKYACVQCIRGHRSSTCKHSSRPLVQVRSRGRPSLNASHRIAVTESELVLSRDEVTFQDDLKSQIPKPEKDANKGSCYNKTIPKTSAKSCCSSSNADSCNCGKNNVILLKASKRQFVDVKDGSLDFVGPFNNQSVGTFNVNNNIESIHNKRQKHTRSSCCSSKTAETKADAYLTLLKTLKVSSRSPNRIDAKLHNNKGRVNSSILPNVHSSNKTHTPNQDIGNFAVNDNLFQYSNLDSPINHDGRTIQSLEVKPNDSRAHIVDLRRDPPSDIPSPISIQSQYRTPSPSQASRSQFTEKNDTQLFHMMVGSGCADECFCGPECSCPGCLIHRTNEELKELGLLDSSTSVSTPTEKSTENFGKITFSEMFGDLDKQLDKIIGTKAPFSTNTNNEQLNGVPNKLDSLNFEVIDEFLLQEMFDEVCCCGPEECTCFNCARHGISDGIRLSDGKSVADINVTPHLEEYYKHTKDTNVSNNDTYRHPTVDHDCGCLPDECECYNCPKHGIINGIKLN